MVGISYSGGSMSDDLASHASNGLNEWRKHVLKELERLNENYEALIKEITHTKAEVLEIKLVEKSVKDIEDWKKHVDDVVSPTQLKDLKLDIENLKIFKIKAVTVIAILQLIMGLFIAFKDRLL